LICGVIYISPVRTKYSYPDPHQELQTEINFDNEPISLFTDFNLRIGNKNNFVYVQCDRFILESMGNDNLLSTNNEILNTLHQYNAPIDRKVANTATNENGNMLIDFCVSNDLFIVNGRVGIDFENVNTTCKGRSTIDFFICTPYIFEMIKNFQKA
jgi:hypothetical protein